jgi:hypothetical protein
MRIVGGMSNRLSHAKAATSGFEKAEMDICTYICMSFDCPNSQTTFALLTLSMTTGWFVST